MSIFKSVKRAFGFSGNEYDPDIEEVNFDQSPEERTPYINPFKKENEPVSTPAKGQLQAIPQPKKEDVTPKKTEEIILPDAALNGLISMINSTLPEFVRNCIDAEAQKKYICDSMGESFKSFAAEIKEKALAEEREQWAAFKDNSVKKINELTALMQELKSKGEETNTQYLSSERQKRALNERIHEIEGKMASLEAEAEQYELENKSLLNKLKVVQVKSDDIEYFKKENEHILEELNKYKLIAASSQDLESQLAGKSQMLEAAVAENATLQQDAEAKDKAIADIKTELQLTVEMVNSLRKEAAAAKAELTELKSLPAPELPVVDETELIELKEKLKLATDEISSLQEELQEANSNLEIVGEIQEQLEKVDELKKRKDEKIENLNLSIKEIEIKNASLRSEIEFLKSNGHYKEKEYSRKLKELAELYESELAKQREELSPKKKKEDNSFDMTELDDDMPIVAIPEPAKAAPVASEPQKEYTPTHVPVEAATPTSLEVKLPAATAIDEIEDLEPTPVADPIIAETPASQPEVAETQAENEDATMFFSSSDTVLNTPKISAIAHDQNDWLKPSPPTAPTVDTILEVDDPDEKESKLPKKDDNTLQMSLF